MSPHASAAFNPRAASNSSRSCGQAVAGAVGRGRPVSFQVHAGTSPAEGVPLVVTYAMARDLSGAKCVAQPATIEHVASTTASPNDLCGLMPRKLPNSTQHVTMIVREP